MIFYYKSTTEQLPLNTLNQLKSNNIDFSKLFTNLSKELPVICLYSYIRSVFEKQKNKKDFKTKVKGIEVSQIELLLCFLLILKSSKNNANIVLANSFTKFFTGPLQSYMIKLCAYYGNIAENTKMQKKAFKNIQDIIEQLKKLSLKDLKKQEIIDKSIKKLKNVSESLNSSGCNFFAFPVMYITKKITKAIKKPNSFSELPINELIILIDYLSKYLQEPEYPNNFIDNLIFYCIYIQSTCWLQNNNKPLFNRFIFPLNINTKIIKEVLPLDINHFHFPKLVQKIQKIFLQEFNSLNNNEKDYQLFQIFIITAIAFYFITLVYLFFISPNNSHSILFWIFILIIISFETAVIYYVQKQIPQKKYIYYYLYVIVFVFPFYIFKLIKKHQKPVVFCVLGILLSIAATRIIFNL